jgi:hypothetical protein
MIQTNYYPIQCTDVRRNHLIKYTFRGRPHEPNIIYASQGSVLGKIPFGYQATELCLCPTVESMREFPFLTKTHMSGSQGSQGAIVITHKPVTNGVPLYSCFFLTNTNTSTKTVAPIEKLFKYKDTTKQLYQDEPFYLEMQPFIGKNQEIPIIHEDSYDDRGKQCIVMMFTQPIAIRFPKMKEVHGHGHGCGMKQTLFGYEGDDSMKKKTRFQEGMTDDPLADTQTKLEDANTSGVNALKAGSDNVNSTTAMFSDAFLKSNTSTGAGDPSISISQGDDPNYTYQECTMMPVDDINIGANGQAEYSFQVAADSSIVTKGVQTNFVTSASGVVMYFMLGLLVYFGTPFAYRIMMCNVLAGMNRNTSATGGNFISYLKNVQDFFGMAKITGLAIVFNIVYFLVILGLSLGTLAPVTCIYTLYATIISMILIWVIGYIGVANNPLPQCV